jgi:septal ring-binding cell division protein DamX
LPAIPRSRAGRPSSVAGWALALLAPLVLAGCGKDGPASITVLSNGHRTTVPAQPACTMLTRGGCPPQAGAQRTVTAAGGSQIEVDVPASLAKAGWIVTAYTTDGTTNTPLQSPAGVSTGTITGQRTALLNVPRSDHGSYYLRVVALRPSSRLTNWLCLVEFGS